MKSRGVFGDDGRCSLVNLTLEPVKVVVSNAYLGQLVSDIRLSVGEEVGLVLHGRKVRLVFVVILEEQGLGSRQC